MSGQGASEATVARCLTDRSSVPNRAVLLACAGPSRPGLKDADLARHAALQRVLAPATSTEQELVDAVQARRAEAMRRIGDNTPATHHAVSVRTKVLIGTGVTSSFFATGLQLHPVYGWPYIPGHALKGVVRAWVQECATFLDMTDVAGAAALLEHWSELLGVTPDDQDDDEPGEAGTAVFLDAHPHPRPGTGKAFTISIDMINPHLDRFTDPTPVTFVSVNRTTFRLDILGINAEDTAVVTDAVDTVGVGAKTGSGYGYLRQEAP